MEENKKFTIRWCEVTKKGETNGRKWQITKMTLADEQGVETEGVSTFESVMNGGTIEGKIVKDESKGYLNFVKKLEAPAFIKGNSAYKEKVINESMARKESSIGRFQDNKEWSIKVSSTMRDAVQLAIAEQDPTPDNILKWRKWLWNNWDVELEDTDAITGKLN